MEQVRGGRPAAAALAVGARVVVVVAVASVFLAAGLGCASGPAPVESSTVRLLSLERSFASFTRVGIADLDDVERETAALESLRIEWLEVLSDAGDERDRLLALLRLAELHLDLSARVRRVAYPAGLDEADRAAFDARLSSLALPLEATGQGILAQVIDRAVRAGVDGRFVRRARLYLGLQSGHALDDAALATLRAELVAATFRAPRTLLEAGRIGQRAAR